MAERYLFCCRLFFFLPATPLSFSGGIAQQKVSQFDAAGWLFAKKKKKKKTELLKSFLEWDICSDAREEKKKHSSERLFCRLMSRGDSQSARGKTKRQWCSNSNILTRKMEPLSESLWLFLRLMAAVMSIQSEYVCVCVGLSCVYWATLSAAVATQNYFDFQWLQTATALPTGFPDSLAAFSVDSWPLGSFGWTVGTNSELVVSGVCHKKLTGGGAAGRKRR